MKYPDGACADCGERLYGTADGGTFCPNCGDHLEGSVEGTTDEETESTDAVAEAP